MSSPIPRYRKTDGLRIRPVPEMQMCIAFTPAEPELFTLNSNAWLILELAPGRSAVELSAAYQHHAVPPQTELVAARCLREGIDMLTSRGILELTTSPVSEQPE